MRSKRMTQALILIAFALMGRAWAAEPLVGIWKLERQEMNGEKKDFEALTLRIGQIGDKLAFAFSVPVNNVHYTSMSYRVRLDGTEADIKNGQGEKLGTVKMTKISDFEYKLILSGPNKPQASGTLTVAPDGKQLTSVSGGLTQVFSRP